MSTQLANRVLNNGLEYNDLLRMYHTAMNDLEKINRGYKYEQNLRKVIIYPFISRI